MSNPENNKGKSIQEALWQGYELGHKQDGDGFPNKNSAQNVYESMREIALPEGQVDITPTGDVILTRDNPQGKQIVHLIYQSPHTPEE